VVPKQQVGPVAAGNENKSRETDEKATSIEVRSKDSSKPPEATTTQKGDKLAFPYSSSLLNDEGASSSSSNRPSLTATGGAAQETKQNLQNDPFVSIASETTADNPSPLWIHQKNPVVSALSQVSSPTSLESPDQKSSSSETDTAKGTTSMEIDAEKSKSDNALDDSSSNIIKAEPASQEEEKSVEFSSHQLSKEEMIKGPEQQVSQTKTESDRSKLSDEKTVNDLTKKDNTKSRIPEKTEPSEDSKAKEQSQGNHQGDVGLSTKSMQTFSTSHSPIFPSTNSAPDTKQSDSSSVKVIEKQISVENGKDSSSNKIRDAEESAQESLPVTVISASTVTTAATDSTGGADASKQSEPGYLLDDAEYNLFHSREDKVHALRRSLFSKRVIPPINNKKSKSNQSGNQTKKRKIEHHRLSEWLYSPPIAPALSPAEEDEYKATMIKAVNQVEVWMEHYRLARKTYWRWKRSSGLSKKRINRSWGSMIDQSKSVIERLNDQNNKGEGQNNKLFHCLESMFVGPLKGDGDSTDMTIREHMALSGHHLAASLDASGRLYCLDCGDFIRHEVFDNEWLRIDLEEKLPWLAWGEQPVARSFDAMHFVNIPEVGIVWNGMTAAYPLSVPSYHLKAAQRCHLRLLCFAGDVDALQHRASRATMRFTRLQRTVPPSRRFKICKPVGIYNLGDTCFQSAVFQCLLNCTPLQTFFLHVGHDHAACRMYAHNKRSLHPPGITATPSGKEKQTAPHVCLASELDKMFLDYYSSSIGFNVTAALSEKHQENSDHYFFKPQGDPISAAEMLAATWKCKDLAHLAGYGQNDAHEFLHGFLDVVQKHMQKFRSAVSRVVHRSHQGKIGRSLESSEQESDKSDVIKNLFEGKLRSVLLCTECGQKRKQSESFLSISLPLAKDVQRTTDGRPGESSRGHSRKLSIERQLRHFTLPESLSGIDCPTCKKKTTTIKQHVVSKLPKILCLHLKRFDDKRKIGDFVSFPLDNLNMGSLLPQFCEVTSFGMNSFKNIHDAIDNSDLMVDAELPYDLFGTVTHFGTLQSGHYVANVKVEDNWYHCNDAHVSYISEQDVLKSEAYLLFYARR
jgi:ubiquitin C-terminal hydrolase